MKEGPDIARLAALIGDPCRANIMTALMAGKALTASELAEEAGVALPTASGHLAKLTDAALLVVRKQGRHKYFTLASPEVAQVLEALMGLAAGRGLMRTKPGPRDHALRQARVCYNHLAGQRGVQLYDSLIARDLLRAPPSGLTLTAEGEAFLSGFGLDPAQLATGRAPVCRDCLDWSERRHHLAGAAGRALLARIEALGWARRDPTSRAVHFTRSGARAFDSAFPPVARVSPG